MNITKFQESMYKLIVETSTKLPKDVRRAIKSGKEIENAGTSAAMSFATITNNIKMADDQVSPICQDTGLPTFKIKTPVGVNQLEIKEAIHNAIAQATKDGKFVRIRLIRLLGKIVVIILEQERLLLNLNNGKKIILTFVLF